MAANDRRRAVAAGAAVVLVLAAALAMEGCTADTAGPGVEVETITRQTEGDRIVIDLRDTGRAWLFDPAEGDLPIDRVLLICPNGAFMRLSHWLSEQDEALGLEIGEQDRTLFSLGPEEEITSRPIEQVVDCEPVCRQCTDGAWICVDPCAASSSGDSGDRSGDRGDGNVDGPLDDPYGGSGSAGGGGGTPGSGSGGSSPPPEPYDPRDPAPPMY